MGLERILTSNPRLSERDGTRSETRIKALYQWPAPYVGSSVICIATPGCEFLFFSFLQGFKYMGKTRGFLLNGKRLPHITHVVNWAG